jgi:hypothetical protein
MYVCEKIVDEKLKGVERADGFCRVLMAPRERCQRLRCMGRRGR